MVQSSFSHIVRILPVMTKTCRLTLNILLYKRYNGERITWKQGGPKFNSPKYVKCTFHCGPFMKTGSYFFHFLHIYLLLYSLKTGFYFILFLHALGWIFHAPKCWYSWLYSPPSELF